MITIDEKRKEKLAIELFKAGIPIFKESSFKLHEKCPEAPLFLMKINLRKPPTGNLTNDLIKKIGKSFAEIADLNKFRFDFAAGLPKAGTPLAQALILAQGNLRMDHLIFLKKEEISPTERRISSEIAGKFAKGKTVVIVDDVISMSDTKIEAFKALRSHNLIVTDCIVLIDWELGGKNILAQYGVNVHAVYAISKLLSIWQNNGLLTKEQCDAIIIRKNKIKEFIEKNK